MRPTAFQAAMAQASRALVRAGVFADVVDVGGGFPSVYPGMVPPDLADYLDCHRPRLRRDDGARDHRAVVRARPRAGGRGLLDPDHGRAAKGDALYLNDGSYGSLFDAAHTKWPFPVKLLRGETARPSTRAAEALPLLRPDLRLPSTHMPGPFWLPDDVREGDYVEIGMLGAYGVAMTTRFNGFGDVETVRSWTTRRWPRCSASPPRTMPTPREAETAEVVKLSRARRHEAAQRQANRPLVPAKAGTQRRPSWAPKAQAGRSVSGIAPFLWTGAQTLEGMIGD